MTNHLTKFGPLSVCTIVWVLPIRMRAGFICEPRGVNR